MERCGGFGRSSPRMKKRFLLMMGCVAALAMMPTLATADTPLTERMDEVDGAYKAFRREQDPAKGAAAARDAQEATLKAILETPALISKIADPAAKAKAVAAYRKTMGRLFITLCEVEEAFLAKDLDKVAELVETLKSLKKEGHDQFMEEE
jgi:hypothetical protein